MKKETLYALIIYFFILLALTIEKVKGQNDTAYYGYGHVIGSGSAADYIQTPVQQLQYAPLPRYNKNNMWMNRNVSHWLGTPFLRGYPESTAKAYEVQEELIKNWYYGIALLSDGNVNVLNMNSYFTKIGQLANAYPTVTVDFVTNYAQSNPMYQTNQNYNDSVYVRSGGNFTDGISPTTQKYPDIYTPNSFWPAKLILDATHVADRIRAAVVPLSITNLGNRVRIFENDEQPLIYRINPFDSAVFAASNLNTAKVASGKDWYTFIGDGAVWGWHYYLDSIKAIYPNAVVSVYNIGGYRFWQGKWTSIRKLQTNNSVTNNMYYATDDFYPDGNSNLRTGYSARHGLDWYDISRYEPVVNGDSLFSPYVSAGWNANPENDINPATWLGALKVVAGSGVDYFLPGSFGGDITGKGYACQAMAVSYVQALLSRIPQYRSSVLQWSGTSTVSPFPVQNFIFPHNNTDTVICSVRKSGNVFLFFSTMIHKNSKKQLETVNRTFTIGSDVITFPVRSQGSVYVWDKDSSVFYQVDGWHENKHYTKWSKDFYMEGELSDNYCHKVTAGNTGKNFSVFTTAAYLNAGDTATYTFAPRDAVNYYLSIKAKAGTVDNTITITTKSRTYTIGCLTAAYAWYNKTACGYISIKLLPSDTGTIKIAGADTYIDQLYFCRDSTTVLGYQPMCGVGSTFAITISNPCGTSATLDAGVHDSYLWSTAATTQTITATAGTYTCTVTDGACTGSASKVVTTTVLPIPTITGPSTSCGGNVVLDAGTFTSYLWSTGATTRSITISSTGTYTCTVTQNSCTGSASKAFISIAPPTITFTGTTSFCNSSTLTCTTTAQSFIWSTGATTAAITASAAGTYTCTATNAGCSATGTVVCTKYAAPSPAIYGSLTFTAGDSTQIYGSGYSAYVWSNGKTTSGIYVKTAGIYTLTVTDGNGCTATKSASVTSTAANCDPPENIQVINSIYYKTKCSTEFTWGCLTDPPSFEIEITNQTGYVRYRTVPGNLRYVYLTGLSSGKVYKVRIRSVCTNSVTSWSSYFTFNGPQCQ